MRGALPYHKALRGTMITVGDFSRGSKEAALFPGAAPITLINGDRLIELLLEHEIAVIRKPVDYFEVDEEYFSGAPVEEGTVDETGDWEAAEHTHGPQP